MSAMWNQWPVAAVPVAPLSAPPQPSVPPPLPDAPPPPPPADHIATDPAAEGVTGAGHAIAGYMASGASQSASNPYEQYTAAQYAAMTPEQQYALQQHWQQWQIYQQEYAKWHAQYGEQYKREMAAAAATTTVPTVPPVPIAAPVKGSEPAIGPVYPQVQLAPQMTAQQSQIQTYFQHPPQSQSQLQLSGKIMAQPQMYNHPPPPPPQGYQQQLQPQLQPLQKQLPRQQQPTASNQWQHHHSPPVRFNKMLPVNYNQVQNSGDPSMFPNLQQPPPSFIQQPPLSAPVNQIDAPWSKEPNKNNIDRSNINDVDRHWYGPPDFGQQQQGPPHNVRWQSNEQGNNKNNANKPDSFGNRRNWQNNPSSNNKNSNYRNNPFSSAPLSRYNYDNDSVVRHTVDSPSGKFGGDAAGPGASNSNTTRGGGSYLSSSNMGNFGNNASGQGVVNNFGPGSFENSCRAGNTNGRWEHNHPNQSGNLGSSHNNNNDGGFNRAPNQKNFNQQQRATDLDEASFDRLFDQWEKQFEDWKCANANHPDRDEYRRYEEEFEKQRRRIAERREQMRRRRQLQNPQQSNQQPELYQQQGVKSRTRYDNYQENDFRCEQHNRDNIRNIDQLHKQISEADLEHELSNKFGEKEADYFETESKQQQESTNKKPEQVVETSAQSQQSSQKQKQQHAKNSKSATPSPTTTSKIQQKQPQQEVDKNKSTANMLGKRKTDESINMGQSSTPAKHTKQENILIISLDDDEDDDADYVQEHQADKEEESVVDIPMNNIFKRNCGIPGLDLVADGQTEVSPCVSVASRATDASKSGNNKKIPSLFDVVISKPGISPPTNSSSDADKERSTTKTSLNESLPDDVNKVLKDPEFMNNLSQALAQAQGRDQELQQQQNSNERPEPSNTNNSNNSNNNSNSKNNNNSSNNEGRALSFAEWQRKKNNRASNQQDEEHTRSFGFGPESGNGSGNRGGYGPGKGGGFGSDQGQQKSGPSGGIPGANGPLSGPNFSGRQGNGSGPGPNSRHNASFGRNFGPCGSNNGNFSGSVPNFNERGHNFDPNFRDNGPGQVSVRPNFGVPIGLGPGPNFGGPGPFCGPGRMNTTGPFERNFGPGSKNSNERNINGANMSNNKNSNSFTDNPFRRNVGPSAPNFDECLLDGPGYTPHCKGQFRNNFANAGNNNKSWADGAESFGNFHPNEPVYRPMQVFDYQNSRNTAAKVIDYGHKSADTAGSRIGSDGSVPIPTMPDFRPVKTFDYGHASQNAVLAGPEASPLNRNCITNSNTKKKNKKKNKNRQRLFQQQQQQEQQSSMLTSNRPNDLHSTGAADQSTKQEELEDISDGEDNLTDATRVESPPPQPKIDKQPHQQPRKAFPANPQRRMLGESPAAIFPSTASASQQLHDQSETKRLEISVPTNENRNTISIDEVLLPPGRYSRPKRICIILRGPPGSGKSYVARLVKDKELEMGGANPRILSIDDYFIIENDYEEKCPKTGKKIPKKEILYEYDDAMEETYMQYLIKSFKKTLSDNLYDLIIVDCNNSSLRTLNEFYCHAKDSNFVPYIIDLHCDVETCLGRNSHQRSEDDIRAVLGNWCTTPLHYIKLDASTLLENVVEMEDVENMVTDNTVNIEEGATEVALNVGVEEEDSNSADAANDCGFLKSRWENDTTEENLARLDGTNRLMQKRKTASMAEFLQLDDWEPPTSGADGKKRVRWADIEEKRAQQKMRAIGFVVGQTDWKRMMDPNAGNRALNKTKYIERVNKRR